MSTNEKREEKEILGPFERGLELVVVPMMGLLFAFLLAHQRAGTGFFTARFGTLEQVCLYGPIFVAMLAPVVRALTGRRNPGRLFEAAANLSLAAGSLWLLIRFPFDFTHLADVLPAALRFVLAWVPDLVGWMLMFGQVVIGPISALLLVLKYFRVQRAAPGSPAVARG